MIGPGSSTSTDPRQDDDAEQSTTCAHCGHALAIHDGYGQCESWPFCACLMFREARSRTSDSSPSTETRQDDAERVFVAFEKGTPGSTFLVGVFATEREADEWAAGRPYACDVMDVKVADYA